MRYFVVFFFILFAKNSLFSQETIPSQKVFGTIVNYSTQLPLGNVNIININNSAGQYFMKGFKWLIMNFSSSVRKNQNHFYFFKILI